MSSERIHSQVTEKCLVYRVLDSFLCDPYKGTPVETEEMIHTGLIILPQFLDRIIAGSKETSELITLMFTKTWMSIFKQSAFHFQFNLFRDDIFPL